MGVHRRHRSRPVTGRRRQKGKGGFATKEEAEGALHEFIRYIEGGGDPCPERITLAEYLNRWLEFQRARGIRRTLDGYEGYVRREIIPVIGSLELAKVRSGHVTAVLARVQQRGLSAATIAQVRNVLGSALRQAVADGLITVDPVVAVKRPGMRRRELRWPTSAQLGAFLEVPRGTMWEVPIQLAAVTGTRRLDRFRVLHRPTFLTFSWLALGFWAPEDQTGWTALPQVPDPHRTPRVPFLVHCSAAPSKRALPTPSLALPPWHDVLR